MSLPTFFMKRNNFIAKIFKSIYLSLFVRTPKKVVKYLRKQGATIEDIKELTEDDTETVKSIQQNLGYFIEYKNLFSKN